MGAYADLLTEMVALVEAVTGLDRFVGPSSGEGIPAQALGGGFTCRFIAGSDTETMRNRAFVRDSHEVEVVLWYLADHNDALTTEKAALDHVIGIRNAIYPGGSLTGAVPTAFGWDLSTAAGGEAIRVQVSTTIEHTTAI